MAPEPLPTAEPTSPRPSGQLWQRLVPAVPWRIAVASFVCGFALMAVEMLVGRLLTPEFGGTIFTWGAVIGVALASLAIGYWLGGPLGDARPRSSTMALLLLLVATLAFLLPVLSQAVFGFLRTMQLGPAAGPAVAAALLLGPAMLALGACSPVAVSLSRGAPSRSGATAGGVSGISSLGGILGTFVTVFVLMPVIDLRFIFTLVGGLVALTALTLLPIRRAPTGSVAVALVLTLLATAGVGSPATLTGFSFTGRLLESRTTPYHTLFVTEEFDESDDRHVRSLYLDRLRHSTMIVERPLETTLNYVEFLHLGALVHGNAARVLFIGGGGMTAPKQYLDRYPGVIVDVVEVDPAVASVAQRFFAVPDSPSFRIHVDDGRTFLAGARETWDVIVLDAYGRDYVPFHLMTLEFLRIVRDHLAPGGVLLTNLIGSREGPASTLLRSEAFTLSQVFPWTQHVPTRSDLGPYMVEETIIVASQAAPERWARLAAYPDEGVEMPKVHDARILADLESMRLSLEGVPTLTDHFAPVETFLSPVTMESFRAAG